MYDSEKKSNLAHRAFIANLEAEMEELTKKMADESAMQLSKEELKEKR